MGMLLERLEGVVPSIDDLSACEEALCRFHRTGMIHGDVNRHNFLLDRSKNLFGLSISNTRHRTSSRKRSPSFNHSEVGWEIRLEEVDPLSLVTVSIPLESHRVLFDSSFGLSV